MTPRPIGFLTDYGPQTEHVGALHAVVASIAPASPRVDLAHDVPPGDVRWGAILLERLVALMPRQSVTIAVVDPGVGTDRRAVAVALEWDRLVVGPDNGLLYLAADRLGGTAAVQITSPDSLRQPVSATFHGRDVFAPAAAHLAVGMALADLGPPVPLDSLTRPHLPEPHAAAGRLEALIAGCDRFGNLALWATPSHLTEAGLVPGDHVWVITSAGRTRAQVAHTFGDVPRGGLLVHVDSHGLVAVAVNGGSATEHVRATAGEVIAIESPGPPGNHHTV